MIHFIQVMLGLGLLAFICAMLSVAADWFCNYLNPNVKLREDIKDKKL